MDGLDGGGRLPSRRDVLRGTGGAFVGVTALGPTVGDGPNPVGTRGTDEAPATARSRPRVADAPPEPTREDFVWLGQTLWRDDDIREHALAFASRRDLRVVLGQPASNAPGVGEALGPALSAAAAAGVEPWVNVGTFVEDSATAFVTDPAVRERHLAGLREVASELRAATRDLAAGSGKVVCWQEAPVMGRWTPDGGWTDASVEALLAHGPAVFAAQKEALRAVHPDLPVGLFVHFPYLVDSKRPEVFADLTDRLREHGTVPDFGFVDFYRGWYEKDAGPDVADAAVRSLVSNARDHLGTDVYYLGQAHTIAPGHTPSRQALRSTLRASLAADASGVGWYIASRYGPTTVGFDPFVPNVQDASFEAGPECTLTVARDRYRDAWAPTLAARADVDPADRFGLWLHGDGFAYADHRVAARTVGGDWRFLGHVGGYLDGSYPHASGRTGIVDALSRARFVADGRVLLRLRTADDADPTTLRTVVAMPWDPAHTVTEQRATELLAGDADVAAHQFGRATPGTRLVPGETETVTVPVSGERRGRGSLAGLVHGEHADAVGRLAAAERESGFDPAGRFDLWLAGRGLGDPGRAPSLVAGSGKRVPPDSSALVAVSTDEVALYYGLERDRFLEAGLGLADDAGPGTAVSAAYAMPYAGSACFRSPNRAATVLADQPDEAATFAAAHETDP